MKRYLIVASGAGVLVLLALLGNFSNKVRTEREAHEMTKRELLKEKKRVKIVRVPVLLPNGQVAFRTEETTETETERLTDTKEKSEKETTEKPALKKWQVMAAQEVMGGFGQMYGGGYRQNLWIIEPAVWTLWGKDLGLVGITVAF